MVEMTSLNPIQSCVPLTGYLQRRGNSYNFIHLHRREKIYCTNILYKYSWKTSDLSPLISHTSPHNPTSRATIPQGRHEFIFDLDRKNVCHFLCGSPYELRKHSLIMHRFFPLQTASLNAQFPFTVRYLFLLFTLYVGIMPQQSESLLYNLC